MSTIYHACSIVHSTISGIELRVFFPLEEILSIGILLLWAIIEVNGKAYVSSVIWVVM